MAKQYGIKHFETSAMNNLNVEESFRWLTEDIMAKKNIDVNKEPGKLGITLNSNPNTNSTGKKKDGCC
jgi:hypothetical protein